MNEFNPLLCGDEPVSLSDERTSPSTLSLTAYLAAAKSKLFARQRLPTEILDRHENSDSISEFSITLHFFT